MSPDVKDPATQNIESILIFTDGACLGNPGPGGWGSIVCMNNRVWELGGNSPQTTNNRMEILATLEALRFIAEKDSQNLQKPVRLYTDSKYVIDGATKWVHGWKRRGWKTAEGLDVKNQDLWEVLSELVLRFKKNLKLAYVRGHSGVPGNERCDEIAVSQAEGVPSELYLGLLENYSIALFEGLDQPEVKKDPYYLSYLAGKIYRDKTWAECEGRVRGQKGAKFKKLRSPIEESSVLKLWGVKM